MGSESHLIPFFVSYIKWHFLLWRLHKRVAFFRDELSLAFLNNYFRKVKNAAGYRPGSVMRWSPNYLNCKRARARRGSDRPGCRWSCRGRGRSSPPSRAWPSSSGSSEKSPSSRCPSTSGSERRCWGSDRWPERSEKQTDLVWFSSERTWSWDDK